MSVLEFREATVSDAQGIARVQVETWQVTYRGIVDDEFLEALSVDAAAEKWTEWLTRHREPPDCVFVATDPEQGLVGYISGGIIKEPEPGYDSELYALYILPGFQASGIGGHLTRLLATALSMQGYAAMVVRVFTNNPARRFYEQLGARYLRDAQYEVGGRFYPEAWYGWPGLRDLATAASRRESGERS